MKPKPRNISALLRLRERGASPPHEIVVSLVGTTPISDALHLYADPGCAYDWSDTRGLHTIIATRPGVDARHAIAGIFKVADEHDCMHRCGYPTLLDVERKQVAHICEITPLRVMQPRRGSEEWAAYFE